VPKTTLRLTKTQAYVVSFNPLVVNKSFKFKVQTELDCFTINFISMPTDTMSERGTLPAVLEILPTELNTVLVSGSPLGALHKK